MGPERCQPGVGPPPLGGRGDLSTSVGLLVPAVDHRSTTGRPPVVSPFTPIFVDDMLRYQFFDASQRVDFWARSTWNDGHPSPNRAKGTPAAFAAQHNASQL